MKIAMISDFFFPQSGGVQIEMLNLSRALAARGHEIHIITHRYDPRLTFRDKTEKMDGIPVLRLCGLSVYVGEAYYLINPTMPMKLKEIFREHDFDVVHGQGICSPLAVVGSVVSKIMHPPRGCSVLSDHSFQHVEKHRGKLLGFGSWIYKKFLRKTLYFLDRVIAGTERSKQLLIANKLMPEDKVVTIPNGVDLTLFKPRVKKEKTRELGLTSGPVVLYVGRLSGRKGVDILLQAMPLVRKEERDTKLLIVGWGSKNETNWLKRLTKDLALEEHVIFHDQVPYHDLPSVYSAADVFVLPAKRGDLFPHVLLEAMACGVPIVCTPVDARPPIPKHEETALFARPLDHVSLANQILRVLQEPKLAKKLATNSLKKIREYDFRNLAKRTEKLYLSVLGGTN
jgi:phosphatidylinositol glycan class A protein